MDATDKVFDFFSILVGEQTQGKMGSAVRSQFDHLRQLYWIVDLHPGDIILSVVL